MKIDLSDKKIIVTGASSGIGEAIAKSLLDAGATLAAHYNSNKKNAENLIKGSKYSKIYKANLAIPEEIYTFFNEVVNDFEKIDMIVHNAGIFESHETSLSSKDWLSVWNKSMGINLNAVGILTQLGIEHFKTNGGGTMVYISSRAAFRGETEEYLAYAASKGGVVSLGRTVARSFGKFNIKSFIIAPGFTETPMAENFISSAGRDKIISENALGQLTQPNDISPIIVLMAAGLMDHATGSTIDFNAGSYIH